VIFSHDLFMWFVTAAAVGICIGWGARDIYLLVVHLPQRGRETWSDQGAWRDQIFGSVFGLVMCVLGIVGALKYHLNW
jgi:hypothetical protein